MFKKVMGIFINNNTSNNNPAVVIDNKQLTTAEIEFLLSLIKHSAFKGDQIEIVYNATLKLQNQHINIQKQ